MVFEAPTPERTEAFGRFLQRLSENPRAFVLPLVDTLLAQPELFIDSAPTAEELSEELELEAVQREGGGGFKLAYDGGDLFGDHSVAAYFSADGEFETASLEG